MFFDLAARLDYSDSDCPSRHSAAATSIHRHIRIMVDWKLCPSFSLFVKFVQVASSEATSGSGTSVIVIPMVMRSLQASLKQQRMCCAVLLMSTGQSLRHFLTTW